MINYKLNLRSIYRRISLIISKRARASHRRKWRNAYFDTGKEGIFGINENTKYLIATNFYTISKLILYARRYRADLYESIISMILGNDDILLAWQMLLKYYINEAL